MTGLRWGILATGGIAHVFTQDLRDAGLTVAAVGSRRPEAARAFAEQHGIPHAHGSYEDLVADPEVDIVYVATPHGRHAADATLALQAGKHVLIEKAVTLNAEEAAGIHDLARRSGLLAMEAMWTRYLPHMARIRELIAGGALGEVRAVIAFHHQRLPTDPTHRLNALALGGGALLDLGVYPMSFIFDMLGAPVHIRATGRLGETGADTEVAASMTHASGAVSSFVVSSRVAGTNTASVLGTAARIELDPVWYCPTGFRLLGADGAVREEYRSQIDGRGMQFQALHAEAVIAEGRTDSLLLPFVESVEIMRGLDEIRHQVGVVYPSERRAPSIG